MSKIIIETQLIEEITFNSESWKVYYRNSYDVKIEKAFSDKIYNVPGRAGVIYNFLEDSYEPVKGADYVVTGILGEMWPITKESLCGYDIKANEITDNPITVKTMKRETPYFAIRIPKECKFSVVLEQMGELKGNRDMIEHGKGDYILCTSFEKEDYRIINGQVFDKMYRQVSLSDVNEQI
jgi:hypothetical protein